MNENRAMAVAEFAPRRSWENRGTDVEEEFGHGILYPGMEI
jgi:hypothetical protein